MWVLLILAHYNAIYPICNYHNIIVNKADRKKKTNKSRYSDAINRNNNITAAGLGDRQTTTIVVDTYIWKKPAKLFMLIKN